MSIEEVLTPKFSIHVHGFSQETLEVLLFVKKPEKSNRILRSVLKNIQTYLTCHLGLDDEHLFVNIGVRSIGEL